MICAVRVMTLSTALVHKESCALSDCLDVRLLAVTRCQNAVGREAPNCPPGTGPRPRRKYNSRTWWSCSARVGSPCKARSEVIAARYWKRRRYGDENEMATRERMPTICGLGRFQLYVNDRRDGMLEVCAVGRTADALAPKTACRRAGSAAAWSVCVVL